MADYSSPLVALSSSDEERARRAHDSSVVVLAHDHLVGWDDAQAMKRGGVTAKVLKLTVDGMEFDSEGHRHVIEGFDGYVRRGLAALDAAYRLAEEHPDSAVIARSVSDILSAKREGRVGLILGFEGLRPLEGSLEVLRCFHRLGVREMQLTWASANQLITGGELNDLGRQVVREMNRLGMLIDLSHLPAAAWTQALELSEDPVIMSHTACHAVSQGGDSITDECIRAVTDKGGVIALHFVSGDYIVPRHGTPAAVIDDLIDHIDHIRDLVGIEHAALGGDYFPAAPEDGWAWVKEIERIDLLPNLTRGLVRRGYSDEEIRMVLGGNLLRLFERVWRG